MDEMLANDIHPKFNVANGNMCTPKPIWNPDYGPIGNLNIELKQLIPFEETRIPSIGSNSDEHTTHDFSIRLEKRTEFQAPINAASNSILYPFQRSPHREVFMAPTCCGNKKWTKLDVQKIITLQNNFMQSYTFVIKLPDKKVNKSIVKQFHRDIRAVEYLQSPHSRRCHVALQNASNRNEIIEILNSQRFGVGFLSINGDFKEACPSAHDADPFTLFYDNVPLELKKHDLIEVFPNCQQIAIGYTSKIYYIKRYAFIIYRTIREAADAFKKVNSNKGIIVRFRLFSGPTQLPDELQIEKCQGNLQQSGRVNQPLITDPGPPVSSTKRNFKVVQHVTIKAESPIKSSNTVLGKDCEVDYTRNCPSVDFELQYERLKQSRLQCKMFREMY